VPLKVLARTSGEGTLIARHDLVPGNGGQEVTSLRVVEATSSHQGVREKREIASITAQSSLGGALIGAERTCGSLGLRVRVRRVQVGCSATGPEGRRAAEEEG
jgi:hypothetical protein